MPVASRADAVTETSGWTPEPELRGALPRPTRLTTLGVLCVALCVVFPLQVLAIPFFLREGDPATAWAVCAAMAALVAGLLWVLVGRFVRRQRRMLATFRAGPARVVAVKQYGGRSAAAYVTFDIEDPVHGTRRLERRIPGSAPPEVVEGGTVTALVGDRPKDVDLYAAVRKYVRVDSA